MSHALQWLLINFTVHLVEDPQFLGFFVSVSCSTAQGNGSDFLQKGASEFRLL